VTGGRGNGSPGTATAIASIIAASVTVRASGPDTVMPIGSPTGPRDTSPQLVFRPT
jgi:hypothetical protein